MTTAPHPGISPVVDELLRHTSLAGKTILEVGADWNEAAATMMLQQGAARVVSTNFAPNWPSRVSADGRLERRSLDARRLRESVPAGSFDVLFGVAVMEHFDDLPGFFAGAQHALRSGGLFFLQGAPLWTSALGHHVWVDGKTRKYHFSDATNPVDDWSHLYSSRQQMKEQMLAKGVDAVDAEAIAHYIYDSQEINRIGHGTMSRQFRDSGFRDVRLLENRGRVPSPAVLKRILSGPYAGEGGFDISGLILAGVKA